MEGMNPWVVTIMMFGLFLLIMVGTALILTAPLWISFIAALLFRGGLGVRESLEKRKMKLTSSDRRKESYDRESTHQHPNEG
jgi:hypothetical protein